MDLGALATTVGPILAAAGALVAITRYVTSLQSQLKYNAEQQDAKLREAALQQDLKLQAANHDRALQRLQDELKQQTASSLVQAERYQKLLTAGNATLAAKQAIDDEVNQIATSIGAQACSVLVPAPSAISGEIADELVFLSLTPDQPTLRGVRYPLSTVGGQVFVDRRPVITVKSPEPGSFSDRTDAVTDFRTESMVAIPLLYRGACVGVAEFLNKANGLPFDLSDADAASAAVATLTRRVADFCTEPRNLESVGITPRQRPTEASILVSDLSNSSALARGLDASVVVDLMNQYFEALCDVGLRHGGTIDQFLGDGFMMTFGIKRPLANHQQCAFAAAVAMQEAFAELKKKWLMLRYPAMATVFNRIGLTCGGVRKAEIGHSQYRQITVMGDAVNTAAHLCDAGRRDDDVIMLDGPILAAFKTPPPTSKVVPSAGSRLAGVAYEWIG